MIKKGEICEACTPDLFKEKRTCVADWDCHKVNQIISERDSYRTVAIVLTDGAYDVDEEARKWREYLDAMLPKNTGKRQ